MNKQRIFSKENPKTKEVARARQLIAAGVAFVALYGVGIAAKNALSQEDSRPTTPVKVESGDTIDKYARTIARKMGDDVDYRDIRKEIIDASPEAQGDFIHPGDILNVPMTDKQIAEQEDQRNDS